MENNENMGVFLRGVFISSSSFHNRFLNRDQYNILVAVGARAYRVTSDSPINGTLGELVEIPVFVRAGKDGNIYYNVPRNE